MMAQRWGWMVDKPPIWKIQGPLFRQLSRDGYAIRVEQIAPARPPCAQLHSHMVLPPI